MVPRGWVRDLGPGSFRKQGRYGRRAPSMHVDDFIVMESQAKSTDETKVPNRKTKTGAKNRHYVMFWALVKNMGPLKHLLNLKKC